MLRPREPRPRDPRRHAVHGHDRRAPDRDRREDRQASSGTSTVASGEGPSYSHHARAARRQGQGDRRHRPAATVGDPRLHRRVRREDRQGSWRFYTIPGPGEPGNETWSGDSWKTGGAGVWNSGAYDPETNLVYFGTGNPAPDWDGRVAPRRQPVQRQRRRARRRHRQAEVALPVHAARRARLRLDAGAGARRHPVAGPAAQGDAVGQPQRPRCTCSIASTGEFLLGQAVREGELDGRLRREGPAAARPGQGADARKAR